MRKKIIALLFAAICAIPHAAGGEETVPEPVPAEWVSAESQYFTLSYEAGVDIKAVDEKLRDKVFFFGEPGVAKDLSYQQSILYRLDLLFDHAENILDMHVKDIHINIKMFRYQKELDAEYYSIFKMKEGHRAFYVHAHNTIYVSEEGITEAVIIHEMAHAIVDKYFNIIPPERIRELIVSYVDKHL